MRIKLQVLKTFALSVCLGIALMANAQTYTNGLQDGVVRVKIRPELISGQEGLKTYTNNGITLSGIPSIDKLNNEYKSVSMKRVFRYSPQFEAKHQEYGLHLWYEISYSETTDPVKVAQAYSQLGEVMYSEPIHEKILSGGTYTPLSTTASAAATEMPYNDPYLEFQWHYNNTGQTGGTPGADIKLFDAWNLTSGSSDIIVSIHDEGIQYDHDDLKNNMWINEAELNGEEGVDDDGNGYKDDVYGFNFSSNMGSIDKMAHGTHVAGTVAAENNNSTGVSGVAGGSGNGDGVRLMSCQIIGGVASGNTADSYVYAADMGAIISQNSWGYSSPGVTEEAVLDAIRYFISEAGRQTGSLMKGGVVIFAAGNSDHNGEWYPGYYEECISVAALDAKQQKASYSNYGDWIHISAPGGESNDNNEMTAEQINGGYSNGVLSTVNKNGYAFYDGTSMACPHVSGVAALVVAQHGGEGFTNEKLITHLLSGTDDIYSLEGNQAYIGQLGNGALNAKLALATDNHIAPSAITDLALDAIAQDFGVISWTASADEDDDNAVKYGIYISKEPLSASTLDFARYFEYTSTAAAGEKLTYEVANLDAVTDYYFVVVAIDRWGNKSGLSNIAQGTTNAGPDASIDVNTESLTIDIDVTSTVEGQSFFNLHNTGEGLLRWDLEPRNVSIYDIYSNDHISYPVAKSDMMPSNIKIGAQLSEKTYAIAKPFGQDAAQDVYEPFDPMYNLYFIGETDLSYTNSMAIRFMVEQEEGFNLTRVTSLLNHDESTGNVILEIYKGADISTAQLLLAQEIDYTSDYYTYTNLNEQLYVEKDEYFWVVYHVPANNQYPLGAGVEKEKDISNNCFMSFNMGKSWARFEDVYYDNQLVWAITAISDLKHFGDFITLSPMSGELANGETQQVDAMVNATELINGTYTSNIVINTNETGEAMLRVPATVTVNGQLPEIKGDPVIEFGNVLLGNSKEIEVTLRNEGYGYFSYPNASFSNTDFEIVDYMSTIAARNEVTFRLRYTPSTMGNTNCVMTLSNWTGLEHKCNLFGVGTEPPVMVITPASADFAGVTIGDALAGSFAIGNEGKYPLNFYLPQFSEGENVGEFQGEFCKFGYTTNYNLGGVNPEPVYNWIEISNIGTELTDYEQGNYFYSEVPIGFAFPFFGMTEESIYITNRGMLSFDTNSVFNVNPPRYKNEYNPDRYISATGFSINMGEGGKIFYHNLGDHFVIQYQDVLVNDQPYTYQYVLHMNGDIYINYKTCPTSSLTSRFLIAIEDQNQEDGVKITENQDPLVSVIDETAVKFTNPGLGIFTSISQAEGTIQPGDSVIIDYTIKTEDLNVEDYVENLSIISNDPMNSSGVFAANINVVAGGTANIETTTSTINFGDVFQNDIITFKVTLVNSGRAYDNIQSATFRDGGEFTVVGDIPVYVKAKSLSTYTVSVNTANLGAMEDELTFTNEFSAPVVIALTANIIEAPVLTTTTTDITQTLAHGDENIVQVTINNTGGNDLHVAPVGNDWLSVNKVITNSATVPEFMYHMEHNRLDETLVEYVWEDIAATGTKFENLAQINSGDLHFWDDAELPFDFSYYGNTYSTLTVGYSGMVAFGEVDKESAWFFGDNVFPTEGGLDNYIGVMSGFIVGDGSYDNTGVYYKGYDDRFVVQYTHFMDGFFMGPSISFQIILFKSGTIKMQYNFGSSRRFDGNRFSTIGIENADGTEGVSFSSYTDIVQDGLAINYTPVKRATIAPGAIETFDVSISAKALYAGTYTDNLVILNNAVGTGEHLIPVNLTVTGEAVMEVPSAIDFGQCLMNQTSDYKELTLSNTGAATLEIFDFDVTQLTSTKVEAYMLVVDPWWGSSWSWVDVSLLPLSNGDWFNPQPVPIYLEPGESMKLRATVTPTSTDVIADVLTINTDQPTTPDYTINFNGNPYEPAVFVIDTDEINVMADIETFNETRSINIDNVAGKSDLEYSMTIYYERNGTSSTYTNSTSMKTLSTEEFELSHIDANEAALKSTNTVTTDFNRTLSHLETDDVDKRLGFGGSAALYTSTRFRAPENGFNLTHVSTYYTPSDWLNSDILVEIYGGSDNIYNATKLYSKSYTHSIDQKDDIGGFVEFQLEENQTFYPYEYFFVVFRYPTAVSYPQGLGNVSEVQTGRHLYSSSGDEWYDLAGSTYDGQGWMVKAHEFEYASTLWVSLDSDNSGTMAPGASNEVILRFNAMHADPGINKAKMVITTNDPLVPEKTVLLQMNRNKGPEFEVGNEVSFVITESEELTYTVKAQDTEGDSFTLVVDGTEQYLTTAQDGNNLILTFTPDYDAAGLHQFNIIGTDEFGNTSTLTVYIQVENTNRAPEVIGSTEDVTLVLQDDSYQLNVNDLFTDPDGDALMLTISGNTDSLFNIYSTETSAMMLPLTVGEEVITLTATDYEGATASIDIRFTVKNRVGIDELNAATLEIYPNPATDFIRIRWNKEIPNNVVIKLYDTSGNVIKESNGSTLEGGDTIDVKNLASGIYFIEVVSKSESMVQKVVIK